MTAFVGTRFRASWVGFITRSSAKRQEQRKDTNTVTCSCLLSRSLSRCAAPCNASVNGYKELQQAIEVWGEGDRVGLKKNYGKSISVIKGYSSLGKYIKILNPCLFFINSSYSIDDRWTDKNPRIQLD